MEYKHIRIAVIDTETTGLSLLGSGICQIAVKIVDFIDGKFEDVAAFDTYCFPEIDNWNTHVVRKALEVNGTSKEFLSKKVKESQALKMCFNFIEAYNCDYVAGQNVIQYDIPLIINRLLTYGMTNELELLKYMPTLDTKFICKILYSPEEIGSYSLDNFRKHFNIQSRGAHNAIYDVEDTYCVLKHIFDAVCNTAKADINAFSVSNEEYQNGMMKTKKTMASRLKIRSLSTVINNKQFKTLQKDGKKSLSFEFYNPDIGFSV